MCANLYSYLELYINILRIKICKHSTPCDYVTVWGFQERSIIIYKIFEFGLMKIILMEFI